MHLCRRWYCIMWSQIEGWKRGTVVRAKTVFNVAVLRQRRHEDLSFAKEDFIGVSQNRGVSVLHRVSASVNFVPSLTTVIEDENPLAATERPPFSHAFLLPPSHDLKDALWYIAEFPARGFHTLSHFLGRESSPTCVSSWKPGFHTRVQPKIAQAP